MTLPTFTPAARPTTPVHPKGQRIDVDGEARCVCGDGGPLDEVSGFCKPCWRITILQTAYLQGLTPRGP